MDLLWTVMEDSSGVLVWVSISFWILDVFGSSMHFLWKSLGHPRLFAVCAPPQLQHARACSGIFTHSLAA